MDMDKALLDPAAVFASPSDVAREASLTREQKIQILRRWEYDARELQVADEENMGGDLPDQLDQILAALQDLGAPAHADNSPNKQGGD